MDSLRASLTTDPNASLKSMYPATVVARAINVACAMFSKEPSDFCGELSLSAVVDCVIDETKLGYIMRREGAVLKAGVVFLATRIGMPPSEFIALGKDAENQYESQGGEIQNTGVSEVEGRNLLDDNVSNILDLRSDVARSKILTSLRSAIRNHREHTQSPRVALLAKKLNVEHEVLVTTRFTADFIFGLDISPTLLKNRSRLR